MVATLSGIGRVLSDRRGAVALETPFVLIVLFFSLLFPLADLAVAGFALVGGYQTLRDFGQYIQYHPPADLTNYASWKSALPSSVNGYPIVHLHVYCGTADCAAGNTAPPGYFYFETTVTLSPMVLGPVLCGGTATTCTLTLKYSEQFQ
ncbi:MAG TPA: hypothetical protein VL614_22110 [Acetobacteraceae bacterium]|jgi:hypothetical protein|nr:hypothetical protein [Acetobacteraceae bacterium]